VHSEPRVEAPRGATVRLAAAAGDETVLDIPAFLRRQTS
jgi:3-deoxy-D-manno-octulosonic acid (KDO) 8-phosphate synthase